MADSPLQKAPAGLLGLFDLKTLGENPNGFARTLVPVADVRQHYGANGQQVLTTTASSSVGATLLLTVPENQVYRVLAIGALLSCSIGAVFSKDIQIAVVLSREFAIPLNAINFPLRGVTTTVVEEWAFGQWFDEPPLLLPGWQFGARFQYASGGALTQLCRAVVQPLPL